MHSILTRGMASGAISTMINSTNPLVTIGIPTFNRPEGLGHTLSRATSQTYQNLEIVISDNASTDQAAVRSVIEKYKSDIRIRYFRQIENIGSLGNFQFLTKEATGDYFLWMSDDDDVELNYIECLIHKLSENPQAAIVMGGYDIEDRIAQPIIRLNLTEHLFAMTGPTAFDRMKAYILQPDHLAKSRLNWGMFPTPLIRRAFADCDRHLQSGQNPNWADFPIDLRLLSYGELLIEAKVLWHVHLLPSSDGKSALSGGYSKLLDVANHTMRSFSAAIQDSDLDDKQKQELQKIIGRRATSDKIQLFMYYQVIGKWPWLARWVKKIWYVLFS